MVLDDEHLLVGRDLREPFRVEAIEPGHRDDANRELALGEQLGREQGLVEQHRAVRDEQRLVTLAERRATADL